MNESSFNVKIEEENPYTCAICNVTFRKRIYLKGHMKSGHDETSLFLCDFCNTGYVKNCDLQKHQRSVHDGEELPTKKIKCKICNAGFASKVEQTQFYSFLLE